MKVVVVLVICLKAVAAVVGNNHSSSRTGSVEKPNLSVPSFQLPSEGVPADPQRIVGGAAVTIDQYPAIAALLYSNSGVVYSQSCGGSILNTRSILTAAHCPYGDSALRWRVRIGSSFANSGGVLHSIASVYTHPNYKTRTTDNDVAVLRTASVIVYSAVVQPAYIAGVNYVVGDNQVVWAAGWGTTSSGGSTSDQLRHVQVWSVNQEVCNARYSPLGRTVTDNMLCSGWLDVGGRDQCQGDSGGPLYHNNVVAGICSWGYGCANPQYPGVNTRVSRYTTWIQTNA